jgi:alkylhydroperoxidase/carboxymuconolactone decarboxylase family protein YurZ
MPNNPLNLIKESDSALFSQIGSSRELAFKDGEISKKNKLLIALAIDVAKESEAGTRSLAMQALASGATKTEIMETLRIVNFICGVGSMYTASRVLNDIIDSEGK